MKKRVIFSNTSNKKFDNLVGFSGYIFQEYDRLVFEYFKNGQKQYITTSPIRSLTSFRTRVKSQNGLISCSEIEVLSNSINGEKISCRTNNSLYEFKET